MSKKPNSTPSSQPSSKGTPSTKRKQPKKPSKVEADKLLKETEALRQSDCPSLVYKTKPQSQEQEHLNQEPQLGALAELLFLPETSGSDFRAMIVSGMVPDTEIEKLYEATQCKSWGLLVRYLIGSSDRVGQAAELRKEDSYANGMLDFAITIMLLRKEALKIGSELAQ